MSALPDVEKTVNVLKSILSEGVDLASEKRRFQGFLQDYAGRARAEQGLNLERRHLNVLVLGMRYRRFDAVVKGRGDAAGLNGLGDWLARQEGYKKGLCQWVEVVWSKSLGLATDIELDSKAARRAEDEKRRKADEQARRRKAEEQARRREAEVKRQEQAARERAEAQRLRREAEGRRQQAAARQRAKARRQAAVPGKVSRPVQSVEVFRDSLRGGGEGPAMVVLPTGRFRMGDLDGSGNSNERPVHAVTISHLDDDDGIDCERPVHTVTISRRIAMGQYPVTFEDYDRFVAATDAKRPGDAGWGRDRRPVIMVNWHDAKAYAAWLSEQTGKRYRLPSESEWEYAARSGTETAYSWGNEIGVNRANGRDSGSKWSGKQTSPVGSFAPNGFGLYDMHGNVAEWVEDCWHDNYEGAPSDGSAWTSGGDSDLRIVRGGSWGDNLRVLRAAYPYRYPQLLSTFIIGFRLVQDLNP